MADNPTIDNGTLTDYTVSADEGSGGYVQRVKLAYSVDGSETHVSADADGLLVNLGANNDVTVTGTVTANAGTGTMAVSAASLPLPSGAATLAEQQTQSTALSTIAGHVDGVEGLLAVLTGTVGGTELQVDVVSSALPTGAATAAKQPALGTAGTASADVLTVQGIASMTPLAISDNSGSLTVDDGGLSLTVDGTVAVSGSVAVTDNAGSLTVDAPVGTPVFVRLSDGASAITTLPVSLASVPSHAVTNAGTFAVQVDGAALTALQTLDNIVSGNEAQVDIVTMPAITGTVDLGATDNAVLDAMAASLAIVDNVVFGAGTEAAALRVTLATDSTGVVSVDDNGSTLSIDDGGGVITVDGTITAELSATDNAVLDAIAASLAGTLTVTGGGGTEYTEGATDATITGSAILWEDTGDTLRVPSATYPLPIGDAGGTISVDDGSGSLTVDNAGTFAVQASSVVPGTSGTNLGKAVDSAAGATDTGVAMLAVRDDALSTLTPAEGDYTQLRVDANGALQVNLATGISSSIDSIAALGNIAHDATGTGNAPVLTGGYASAAAPADVSADGDAVRAWHLRNGAQATVITAAGALIGGDATNGLDADVTRVIPGTSATHLGKAIDSAVGGTDTGVAALVVRDDALSTLTPANDDYTVLRTDSRGSLWVRAEGSSSATLANANDAATNATLIASNASRRGFAIWNDSTTILYVKFGATASSTSYTLQIAPGGYYEHCPPYPYTGQVDGIWSADASGAARTTEW